MRGIMARQGQEEKRNAEARIQSTSPRDVTVCLRLSSHDGEFTESVAGPQIYEYSVVGEALN